MGAVCSWSFFDPDAVAGQEEERDEVEYHQAHGPEPNTGIHGQSHQGLGHTGGIRIDYAAGKACLTLHAHLGDGSAALSASYDSERLPGQP